MNGEFVSHESQNRALYLLHYVIFNSADFSEYTLTLNKILVGLPIAHPVQPITTITSAEIELSQSMLEGFRSNWSKMQSSSIVAIQETFLKREGILMMREEEYGIQVEKKAVDVLMQDIPWNFNLIALPWMSKPLRIAWL